MIKDKNIGRKFNGGKLTVVSRLDDNKEIEDMLKKGE